MEFQLDLPPEFGARRAPALVRQALRAWDVDDPGATVLMVVTELVENVHQHTGGGGEVRLALDDSEILVRVYDTSAALPAPRDPRSGPLAGRGLRLVRALAKDWGAQPRSAGKVVWARLVVAGLTENGSSTAREPDVPDLAPDTQRRAPCQLS